MKNNRKILPIIFAVMLVACVIKIIISPQILDFVGVVAILLVLIDSIIQLNEEKYLDKKEYKQAKEEWKNEWEKNPEIKRFKKCKRTTMRQFILFLAAVFILCQPIAMFGFNNSKYFVWSYERDMENLKIDNMPRYDHFPSEIPNDAKVVEWRYDVRFGSNKGFLKIKVDDEYIKELEKTFKDKDKVYTYKEMEDPESFYFEYGDLGWFNSNNVGIKDEDFRNKQGNYGGEGIGTLTVGEAVMYITYVGDGMYDSEWDMGVIIDKSNNEVMYFSHEITR